MPIGGHKDFDACVAANRGKVDDPEGYCHSLERKAKGIAAIEKVMPEERLVFGWAYMCKTADGQRVTDHSGEFIEPEDYEPAAYEFVEDARIANDMHAGDVTGRLVESMFFSPSKCRALGLPDDALPSGHWVGFRLDESSFAKVKTGDRLMFSIEGQAIGTAA